MTLSESVAKLHTLLPKLNASDAKFATSLIAAFEKYKGLTPKQEPWIGKLIARAETPMFQVVASYAPTPEAVNVGGFDGVIALFAKAKEHLKFPKIRLSVAGKNIIVSLNGPKSKAPGAISITSEGAYGSRSYYGKVSPDGLFTPAQATYGDFLTALTGVLTELSKNPARVAKDHGKLTGHCCFCNKELGLGKEKRSVLVGFGPDCAEHYGLKAQWLAAADKVAAAQAVTPTLTVSPAAQATIDGLAEQLNAQKELDALAAEIGGWVDDGTDTVKPALEPETLTVGIPVEEVNTVMCFFCEEQATDVKVLNGYTICATCVKTLNA